MRAFLRYSASVCSWACSLLLAAPGCAQAPDKVVVGTVLVNVPQNLEAGGLRERLRQRVREVAEDTVGVKLGDKATHRLVVEVGGLVDENNRTLQVVAVALQSMGAAPDFEALGLAAALDKDPMAAAFKDGWQTVQEQRRLYVASSDELVRKLAVQDKRLRLFAITQLGERRARVAVNALAALLTDDRPVDEVLRVVGALVSIGAEQAVGPLIDLTRRKPPGFVRQIVFAVASIGGELAEAFLVTLAGGHPDPMIQRDANDALAELKQRSGSR